MRGDGHVAVRRSPWSPRRAGLWNVAWRVGLGAILAGLSIDALLMLADWLGVIARDRWPFVYSAPVSAAAFSMPGHSFAQVALRMRLPVCSPGSHFTLTRVMVDYRVLGLDLDLTTPIRLDSSSYRCS